MPPSGLAAAVARVRRAVSPEAAPSDGRLLGRFLQSRDESAFAELVRRHGPMVLAECRRGVTDRHLADDAFQAVFLTLARRAARLAGWESVGGWLRQVARRVGANARRTAARRRSREMPTIALSEQPADDPRSPEDEEVGPVVLDELGRLPDRHRSLLVLHYLDGRPQTEVAARLGLPSGTVNRRMAEARQALGDRLRARGVAPALAGLAGVAVPADLMARAVAAAVSPDHAPAAVAALSNGALRTMLAPKLKLLAAGGLVLAAVAGGLIAADPPAPAAKPDAPRPADAAKPAAATWQRRGDPVESHTSATTALAFTPDGKRLLTGGPAVIDQGNGSILLIGEWRTWDPATGAPDAHVQAPNHNYALHAAAFSPDGKRLAVVCQDGKLSVWDAGKAEVVWDTAAHPDDQSRAVAFGPDGSWLVTAGTDGKVRRWDAKTGKEAFAFAPAKDEKFDKLWSVAVSPDGKTVAAGGTDGTVYLLDAATGKPAGSHAPHTGAVVGLLYTPDGKGLVSSAQDTRVKVWDPATGAVRLDLSNDFGADGPVAVSADGTRLAATARVGDAAGVRVYDLKTGQEVAVLESGLKWVVELGFSPDGKTLAAGGTLPVPEGDSSRGGLVFWDLK